MLGRSRNRDRGRGAGVGGINLLNSATIYLGGVAPFHWLDFIDNRALYAGADVGNVTGATGYSFTRASEGYYTNADGTLTNFASGALRRGDRGVLIEGARTNLLTYSQQFDDAAWTKTNTTVTANATAAPDGTTTADKLVSTAGASMQSVVQFVSTTNSSAHEYSLFVKAAEYSFVRLRVVEGSTFARAVFIDVNLTTGVTVRTDAANGATINASSVTALANGWYRIAINYTLGGIDLISIGQAFLNNGADDFNITGNGTSGIFIWGAQIEAASSPSSYIPTVAASVTRAGSAYLAATTSGLDSAVSMWSQVLFPATTSAVQTIAQFDDGTNDNRLILRRNASGNAETELITGGVSQGTVTGGAMANNTTHKIACSATLDALRLALNGTSATPDTSATMPTGLVNIRVGAGVSIALPSFGYHPRWAMFNSALSGAQLETVTGS